MTGFSEVETSAFSIRPRHPRAQLSVQPQLKTAAQRPKTEPFGNPFHSAHFERGRPRRTVTWLHSVLRFLSGSARDLLPIVGVIALFQAFVLRQSLPNLGSVLIGLPLVLLGWLLAFSFALGFGPTVAEPALIAIAEEASEIAAHAGVVLDDPASRSRYALGLRMTVALAVGAALVIGVARIVMGWPIHIMIAGGYLLVVFMTAFAPEEIIAIAYDPGGVTTSTITVPLVTALGVGLASSIKSRDPVLDGFGLIAFASLTPIMFVLLYGMVI